MPGSNAGQLALEYPERVTPSERDLRVAFNSLRNCRLPFRKALQDPCWRICIRNIATARLRARGCSKNGRTR